MPQPSQVEAGPLQFQRMGVEPFEVGLIRPAPSAFCQFEFGPFELDPFEFRQFELAQLEFIKSSVPSKSMSSSTVPG